jgi:hypothetical protein
MELEEGALFTVAPNAFGFDTCRGANKEPTQTQVGIRPPRFARLLLTCSNSLSELRDSSCPKPCPQAAKKLVPVQLALSPIAHE